MDNGARCLWKDGKRKQFNVLEIEDRKSRQIKIDPQTTNRIALIVIAGSVTFS